MNEILSFETEITLANHYEQKGKILRSFDAELLKKIDKYMFELSSILKHAFRNVAQHGNKDVAVKVYQTVKGIRFEIVNTQIKPFPEALKKRFNVSDKIIIPKEQLVGYKGNGIAHKLIEVKLNRLPKGSFVEWFANGSKVKFILECIIT